MRKNEKKKEAVQWPKVGELRIRLLHEKDKDEDGNWVFAPVFPLQGTACIRIHAKTVKSAKRLLEDYLYNETNDCDEDIWE